MKKTVLAAKNVAKQAKAAAKQAVKNVKNVAKQAGKIAAIVTSGGFKECVSAALDFIPVVGNIKSGIEFITGKDPITGRKLEPWERAVAGVGILGGPAAKAVKHGGKLAVKGGKILQQQGGKLVQQGGKLVEKGGNLLGKAADVLDSSRTQLAGVGAGYKNFSVSTGISAGKKTTGTSDFKQIEKAASAQPPNKTNQNIKPLQVHHYVTNKHKKYTPEMEEVTKKYGLNLNDDWNKELLPHQGRHPNDYHEFILNKMKTFDGIAKGDKEKFLKLFEGLKQQIRNNPEMLYKDYWRSKK